MEAGVRLVEVYLCEELCTSQDARRTLAAIRDSDITVVPVTPTVFARLAFGDRADGLLAVADTPTTELGRLELRPGALMAVLEGIEKPGNLGAVLRSADGAGLDAVVAVDPATDLYNPNAIRASLGTIFALSLAVATAAETLVWLRSRGARMVAARVDGSVPYTEADLGGTVALILGSEAHGLTEGWAGEDVTTVRVPMLGVADSLNVAATAAVLFYEALRQRTGPV